ncbi:MAG: sugar ABC transporter ATP-binding protein [Lachnospiraceae bacterium]|jgi:ribose transport system ATP-binding protein|nr:sugar ABC transporter ATP-binding protein [Lachnospiraceae bacterium]MCI9682607.1 sugar ABC transporter ATP-binding protein [Lachnospiraceae bacterium]
MGDFILEVRDVSKIFPGVRALDQVSLRIRKGEIHALVGENGAGKSTLMKILNGNYKKDAGSIYIDGKEAEIRCPDDARRFGISIIFQELNLVPHLSVAENIFMGRLRREGKKLIDWKQVYQRAGALMERIGYPIDTRTAVEKLSVAQKQMIEIAKAISYSNTKLILMDEPSATLTNRECEKLFEVIRSLKEQGISVIYISHKLEEIAELCEWVTILRDGKIIDTGAVSDFTKDDMISKMIGREISDKFPARSSKPGDKEILRVEGLSRHGVISDISFSLREGEVLGFAGLVGAGRTEIARAVIGMDYTDMGEIYVEGKRARIRSPKDALRSGIAYLSEDRKQEGLVLKAPVKWNISMANMSRILSAGMVNEKKDEAIADEMIDKILIKTPSREQYAMNLSGGNQQKIVVAKWLNTDAKIFIFDEPTRGIDVGAKYEIYVLINELVQEGKSVILISSELPEVLEMCDRVLVINKGKLAAELTGENMNAQSVMGYAI